MSEWEWDMLWENDGIRCWDNEAWDVMLYDELCGIWELFGYDVSCDTCNMWDYDKSCDRWDTRF